MREGYYIAKKAGMESDEDIMFKVKDGVLCVIKNNHDMTPARYVRSLRFEGYKVYRVTGLELCVHLPFEGGDA